MRFKLFCYLIFLLFFMQGCIKNPEPSLLGNLTHLGWQYNNNEHIIFDYYYFTSRKDQKKKDEQRLTTPSFYKQSILNPYDKLTNLDTNADEKIAYFLDSYCCTNLSRAEQLGFESQPSNLYLEEGNGSFGEYSLEQNKAILFYSYRGYSEITAKKEGKRFADFFIFDLKLRRYQILELPQRLENTLNTRPASPLVTNVAIKWAGQNNFLIVSKVSDGVTEYGLGELLYQDNKYSLKELEYFISSKNAEKTLKVLGFVSAEEIYYVENEMLSNEVSLKSYNYRTKQHHELATFPLEGSYFNYLIEPQQISLKNKKIAYEKLQLSEEHQRLSDEINIYVSNFDGTEERLIASSKTQSWPLSIILAPSHPFEFLERAIR